MKKVVLFFAFAIVLSASVVNAQRQVNNSTSSQGAKFTIDYTNKECKRSGRECFYVRGDFNSTQKKGLEATGSIDEAGNPVLTMDATKNQELVSELKAAGSLDLKNDVIIAPEVAEKLTGKRVALVAKKGLYKAVPDPSAAGRFIIRIKLEEGSLIILIKW